MGDRNVLERILSGLEKPTNLPLALLQEITENFSEDRKIGEGAFGEVYKGVLQNRIVAVKRIIVTKHTIDDRLFYREVKNLMKIISHRNVVGFLGFCSNTHQEVIEEKGSEALIFGQRRERLLCFEYIGNGNLGKHITDELRGLEWSVRYEVIKGLCHGLYYLHEEINIIHMDLKPGNIMLDDDMLPKITDFGLSRFDKNTHTSGTRFITQGYCAPEYKNGGKTSKKADMYSLGVIIVELVTGHKEDPNNDNVLRRWRHRWNDSPKHSLLPQDNQVTTCLEIAASCRRKEPTDRPSILDIIDILSKADSTNEHTDQISVYSDDMLGIKPLELRLPFELRKQISSIVKLINNTMGYYAFNIKMPSRHYRTQPNKGIVSPKSMCTIQITMETQETALQDMPYTDTFIVQSTKVDADLIADDITDHMFNREPGEVDEVDLTVVVYEPEEPKGDLMSLEDTKKKLENTVESAFSEDNPSASATRQEEAIPMDVKFTSYKYVRGQCTEQPERLSLNTTPRISRNQQTKMSSRIVDLATGAMGSLRHKLGDLLKEEYNLEISVKTEIESLSEELREMQLALHKVSEVHRDYLDDQVKHWAGSVREMSYNIEDVVDDFLVHGEQATDTGLFMRLIKKMFNLFMWGKTHNPIEDAIKDIKKQVQVMVDRRKKCKVDEFMDNVAAEITFDRRILAIYNDQKELVGIKEPRNKLIKWLSDKDEDEDVSKQQLKIVSIVGFGGLGKTTLAKVVYDKLQSQFCPTAFVPVGRNPNVKKVLEDIHREIGYGSMAAKLDEMQLVNEIRGLLKHKRYLIVIDDIWDSPAWNVIKCAFKKGDYGSSVVTTTRIRSVAGDCCAHSRGYVHEMRPLNDQDSRKLFVRRIFGSQEACHYVPDDIPTDILKKCGGLPLAIISIASLLAHKPRSRWDSIRNSLVSVFEENHDDLKNMEQVLDLSYMHLPHHLKTCLLDIGKYREDNEIKKQTLLRQWTAQGFASKTRLRDAEDVAEDYFCELINMSMIQPGKIDYNDEVVSCRVHDIMLDLIRSKAAEENFNLVIDGPEVVTGEHERVRRVSIHYGGEDDSAILTSINGSLSHVRSVLFFRGSLLPCFLALKYIRVLHLEDNERSQRLDLTGIHGLFLLRYLKIFCKNNLTLPSQIGELRQLETIEVEAGRIRLDEPTCLPSDIASLPQLSHLSFLGGLVLPDGIGRLKSLRTLRGVDFLESSLDNIKSLGELTNLRELEMFSVFRHKEEGGIFKPAKGLELSMRVHAMRSSIGKLGSLRSLNVGRRCRVRLAVSCWSSTPTPLHCLRKLILSSCYFQIIPRWIADLHDLHSLALNVTEVADAIGVVAGLPSLAYLSLSQDGITEERVIISGREFGALKHLNLNCPYMSLVFQAGALPRLEELHIHFRYLMSAELLPVGIEHLPACTLRRIHLWISHPSLKEEHQIALKGKHEAAVGLLLKSAFEQQHAAASIVITFLLV